jgi:hypothetical protein
MTGGATRQQQAGARGGGEVSGLRWAGKLAGPWGW